MQSYNINDEAISTLDNSIVDPCVRIGPAGNCKKFWRIVASY